MKKSAKWLALVLAALMLFATACSATQAPAAEAPAAEKPAAEAPAAETPAAEAPAEEAPTEEAAAENGPLTKYDPPIEMRIVYGTSPVQYFPEGDSYENNVWSRYLEETAGIIFKVMWTADSQASDAFTTKMNMALASGDLPDIFTCPDFTFFKTAVDAGYTADLTEIWDVYPSDRIRERTSGFEVLFEGTKIDGKLYGLPALQYYEQKGSWLWIRDDWLQKVGGTAPTTMTEMVDLARKFTFEDPDGNGQNDTYGLILFSNLFAYDFGNVNGIMAGYGVPTHTDEQFYRDDDGVIKYAGIQPDAKLGLQLIADMFKEGLIDPEFGVKDAAKLEEDINNSKVGMGYGAEWNCWYPYATIYQSDHGIFKPYPDPVADGYKLRMGTPFPVGSFTCANAAYDHPEALIKILNFQTELNNEDSPDEIREKYSDNEQWRFIPISFGAPSEMRWYPEFQAAIDAGWDINVVPTGDQASFQQLLDYKAAEEAGEIAPSDCQGRYWQCGPESTLAIIYNNYQPNNSYAVSPVGGLRPDSYMNLMASLNKIILQAYTEIITGAQPIDYFDTFVENWLAAGGQQVLDDLNEAYPNN